MKYRNGFVSNSSSSSFVVLFPENFDIDKLDLSEYQDEMDNIKTGADDIKKAIGKLIRDGNIYEYESRAEFEIVQEILRNYVIASLDSGPDDGLITVADVTTIKNILEI